MQIIEEPYIKHFKFTLVNTDKNSMKKIEDYVKNGDELKDKQVTLRHKDRRY